MMIGDSITEQHLYSNYVEMWTVTRFPAWNLTFRNTGIGGDTSGGGNGRFQRDVLRYKPTAMTVDFGMNDGGYGGFDKGRFDNYYKGLEGMAAQAKAANLRVAWITPQPLDNGDQGPTALTGYNKTLEQFSEQGVARLLPRSTAACSSISFIRISRCSTRPARRSRIISASPPATQFTLDRRARR